MKAITPILTLAILALFSSCAPTPHPTANITGQLLEADSQMIYLVRADQRVNFREWLEAIDSFQLDTSGQFQFTFEVEKPDYFQVCDFRGISLFPDLYLEGGDSMHLVKNYKDYKTPEHYGGARAGAYGFFDLRDSLRSNDSLFKMPYYETYELGVDSFRNLVESQWTWEDRLRTDYFKDHPEWEPILLFAEMQANYRHASGYFEYLYYHNYYANDTFIYYQVDSSFYGFLDQVELQPQKLVHLPDYKNFMGLYLQDLLHREYRDMPDSLLWEQSMALKVDLAKTRLGGVARDAAFLSMSDGFSMDMEAENFWETVESLDAYFRDNHADELYYRKFSKVLAEFNKLRPGKPAPVFAFPDANGDTVRLSDFLGKVVYIDFWGTWCYPCLEELPHSLKLQEQLKDEDVVFVFIGLESKGEQVEEWHDFVLGKRSFSYAPFLEQRVYPGVHLVAEGQFGNPGLKPYKITFAPTYALIDREGKFVNARASRPSGEKTEEEIRAVLKK